ncbi:MAG: sigma 54-interacting transcriptional regulator [Bacteroidales bacterium]|nr:sigma 54-interacting transcriptional regulator [Bacteroidales bacterium]
MSQQDVDIEQLKQNYSIVGNSPQLNDAVKKAYRLAEARFPVFIKGENGVGKEAIAKIVAMENNVFDKTKYTAINCAAIPKDLIDSTLFGYAKGAFTGADTDKKGLFETADGGTVFLDEVGDLSLDAQAKLLRVIEYGEYNRVGDMETRHTNVRIISATNIDLETAIAENRFRADLYYRLNMSYPIKLPSLAERVDDIPLLFNFFVKKFVSLPENKGMYMPVRLSENGERLLKRQPWRGNVRELLEFAKRIVVFESGNKALDETTLKQYLPEQNLPMVADHQQMTINQLTTYTLMLIGEVKNIKEELLRLQQEIDAISPKVNKITPIVMDETGIVVEQIPQKNKQRK